jgi:hypothetical protein
MKTSTLLISLLILNSSVLFAQFANWIFAYVNPFVMIGAEIILALGYVANKAIKDVRDVFDVDITM